MRILRTTLPALAILAAACSSTSNQPGSAPAPETTNIVHPNTLHTDGCAVQHDDRREQDGVRHADPAPRRFRLGERCPAVFLELDIEPKTVNCAGALHRELVGHRPAFDGDDTASRSTSTAGNRTPASTADQAEVTLSLTVQVVPDSGGTVLAPHPVRGVRDDGWVAPSNRIQCASTGQLEAADRRR